MRVNSAKKKAAFKTRLSVPGAGLEPAHPQGIEDFKSPASAISPPRQPFECNHHIERDACLRQIISFVKKIKIKHAF